MVSLWKRQEFANLNGRQPVGSIMAEKFKPVQGTSMFSYYGKNSITITLEPFSIEADFDDNDLPSFIDAVAKIINTNNFGKQLITLVDDYQESQDFHEQEEEESDTDAFLKKRAYIMSCLPDPQSVNRDRNIKIYTWGNQRRKTSAPNYQKDFCATVIQGRKRGVDTRKKWI